MRHPECNAAIYRCFADPGSLSAGRRLRQAGQRKSTSILHQRRVTPV